MNMEKRKRKERGRSHSFSCCNTCPARNSSDIQTSSLPKTEAVCQNRSVVPVSHNGSRRENSVLNCTVISYRGCLINNGTSRSSGQLWMFRISGSAAEEA